MLLSYLEIHPKEMRRQIYVIVYARWGAYYSVVYSIKNWNK